MPTNNFARLKSGSALIDKGVNVGLPFNGSAPDLGAYEFSASAPPRSIQFDNSPSNLRFTNGGFNLRLNGLTAHGPVVLYASTNLSVWSPILTNPPASGPFLRGFQRDGAQFPFLPGRRAVKFQAPTSKLQILNRRPGTQCLSGAWNLKFLWSLELGAWSFLLFAFCSNAAEYYVSSTGNDSNSGALAAPFFKEFSKAVPLVSPGDTIWMRGGTYAYSNTITITNSGTPGALIKLWAFTNEHPILDFSAMADNDTNRPPLLLKTNESCWHFKGLEIMRAGDNGMKARRRPKHHRELQLPSQSRYRPSDWPRGRR